MGGWWYSYVVVTGYSTVAGTDLEPTQEQIRESQLMTISHKNDFVVWLQLSESQFKLYSAFLQVLRLPSGRHG